MSDPIPGDGDTHGEGGDEPVLDLTPRSAPRGPRRRFPAIIALVILVGALGFVVFRGLGDATLFFYNVDEAVENRDELGDDRFRMQGTVQPGSVLETESGVSFTVVFAGAEAAVDHVGAPPELFQDAVPVVIEGHWGVESFESDRILVKHSEVYVEDNGDRRTEADPQGVDPAEVP
jgi:cytochrome c-type biogenesis protein CcmE